jgi:hypothetical protein
VKNYAMNVLLIFLLILFAGGTAVLVASVRSADILIHAPDEEMVGWDEERLRLVDRAIDRRLQRWFFPPGRRGRARLQDRRTLVGILLAARQVPADGTILAHIVSHLHPSGTGLLPGGEDLPDEEPSSSNDVRWSPGALGTARTHHSGTALHDEAAKALSGLVIPMLKDGYQTEQFIELCELAGTQDLISAVDGVLEAVRVSGVSLNRVRELGQRLARQGCHRGPVKLGVGLLGLLPGNPERELLLTLGRHEEFTLYSAVAISNAEPADSKDQVLLSLAGSVNGWGRIHAVERLAGSADPDVQTWMLREGYRNKVMIEHTAYTAATTGKLAEALADPAADDELIDAAGEILSALAKQGPGPGIDEYTDGPAAVERFLGHVERSNLRLSHFTAVLDIKDYLDRELRKPRAGWPGARAWTAGACEELSERCARITRKDGWVPLAHLGLLTENAQEFHHAERTATALGMDTFPARWQRLKDNPANGTWSAVLKDIDPAQLTEVLDLARDSLPLALLGSGPRDENAGREHFRAHAGLGAIVATLAGFPGRGADLVETCLLSSLIRNRIIALDTLVAWTPAAWPPTTRTALRLARTLEPDESLHERMSSVLA